MNKQDILDRLASARGAALPGTRDYDALTRVMNDVANDEVDGLNLAYMLRGRFENNAEAWVRLRPLFHDLVDEDESSFRPKPPLPEGFDAQLVARVAGAVLYGIDSWEDEDWAWIDTYDALNEMLDGRIPERGSLRAAWDSYEGDNRLEQASRDAWSMFVWSDTAQGNSYWHLFAQALRKAAAYDGA